LPNLLSLTTSCVGPELRPLPSPGVTRLHRYYEPLRHPKAPGLSLAGVRLLIAEHTEGLPVLRALSLCTCRRHYPGAATRCFICSLPQSYQPSQKGCSGRPAHRPFRGLPSVHSHYGLHTRWITQGDPLRRRLQPLRYLHDCSDYFRLEHLPGGIRTHWKAPPFHGAHPSGTLETGCFGAG
jgi:hypothetical protein